jgi:hypothetical protein
MDSLEIFPVELVIATARGVKYAAGDSTAVELRKQSGVERENEEKESFQFRASGNFGNHVADHD